MSFTDVSHTVITGENTINHVQGNQVNGTINAGIVNFIADQEVVNRTVNDEFQYVRRGDMIIVKQLSSEEIRDWDWRWKYGKVTGKHKARRTTCIVEVYPDRQSKFTALMYEGEDAEWLWKKEFKKFSCTKNLFAAQLFGINRSEIPMLIFHDESIWMDIYIRYLKANLRCSLTNIWMSTSSGVLFSGPDGPPTPGPWSYAVDSIIVPTTVDMLKDNTCIRFFINSGSIVDKNILEYAVRCWKPIHLNDLVSATAEDHQSKDSDHPNWSSETHPYLIFLSPDHFPMNVIGGLRFDTVYSPSMEVVARWPRGVGPLWEWRKDNRTGLVEETILDDGLTRDPQLPAGSD
ncbi:hypothetical protein WG66_006036 [Moniliophthora roreri]|nr:hypothetical protein WG66_006036 [Moniliophthora roreri]